MNGPVTSKRKSFFWPIVFLWRGRIYYLFALVAVALSKACLLFEEVFPSGTSVHAVVSFGREELPAIAALLFAAGIALSILGEVFEAAWESGLKGSLEQGFSQLSETIATGIAELTAPVVISWIARRQSGQPDHKEIALAAMKQYYGHRVDFEVDYIDFIVANFFDKSAALTGIVRQNFVSSVILKRAPFDKSLFEWTETKHYDLICPAGEGDDEIRFTSSSRALPTNLEKILATIAINIKVDGDIVFDWAQFYSPNKQKILLELLARRPLTIQDAKMTFDGAWFTFAFIKKRRVTVRRARVTIFERNYLGEDERWYTLSMHQPVFNLSFSLTLDSGLEGWMIQAPIGSPGRYHREADKAIIVDCPGPSMATIRVPHWTLPGIVLAVEWAPAAAGA